MTKIQKDNKSTSNVPPLRFPEFQGEWEVKKLGEVFSIFNGYAFSSAESVDDGILWVKIADVGIQEMKKDNLSFLPLNFKTKYSKFSLKKGDYVVALTRPILNGRLKIAQIDDFFDGALLNQRVGKIETKNSSGFVYCYLQKDSLIKSIENSIAGSEPPNLSPNEINSVKLVIPLLSEQQKIASFLSLIDERIQTQIKIIEELKLLKNTLRNQLFQRVLSEENTEVQIKDALNYEQPTKYLVTNTDYSSDNSLIPVLTANKTFVLGYTEENFGIYDKGKCIILDDFTMDMKFVDFSFKVKSSAIKILTSKSNVNLKFMFEYLSFLGLSSDEHKRHYISEIEPIKILLPNHHKQNQIENILSGIDKKIKIESEIHTLLTKQKQYLLQHLFI